MKKERTDNLKDLKKNIDNDITYLLEQIGHNCKVENEDARAIINNSAISTNYDDKKIITNTELKRGNYINYNNLNFIVLNEINDKRYNSYNKAIIRACNYDIKFIIDEKLFLFYAIAETEGTKLKGKVSNDVIRISTDSILLHLPLTASTELIELNDRFVSMGRAWEVEGIDRTKKGLIILTCKSSLINKSNDDVENEIADRYKDSIDILKGNIKPILPFDEEIEEPESPDPEEPEEPEEPGEIDLKITGETRITVWDDPHEYTVNTDKAVKYSLDTIEYIKIDSQSENKCYISPSNTTKIGKSVLKAELVEDATVFAELIINKYYQ